MKTVYDSWGFLRIKNLNDFENWLNYKCWCNYGNDPNGNLSNIKNYYKWHDLYWKIKYYIFGWNYPL